MMAGSTKAVTRRKTDFEGLTVRTAKEVERVGHGG